MKIRVIFFLIFCVLSLAAFTPFSFAQNKKPAEAYEDICYVYVVDTAKANKYKELSLKSKNPGIEAKLRRLEKEAEVDFPKFRTVFEEEELTTKHYRFPKSKLIITASVYYTDESMASHAPEGYISDVSIIIGISVSNKRERSAIGFPPINSAITEVTYDDHTNMVRAKQYVRVNWRIYLVGLECDCAAKRQSKEQEKK